ncbi:MAG: hypothetical protein R2867_22690 [Caldilineaceae bacterium]
MKTDSEAIAYRSTVPELMGGQNRGPKPLELFMAALGSIGAAIVDHANASTFDMRDMSVDIKMDEVAQPARWANSGGDNPHPP